MKIIEKEKQLFIAVAVSEPEANERGSSLIERRTHFSSNSKAQATVVMRGLRNQ